MFIGEYYHNIDEKGRLAVPVKFRAELAEGAVVTKGLDNCLFLYPKKIWIEMAEKLAELPITDANARAFSRLMLAGAMDVDIDKQGRIILPGYLRKFSQINKSVVVAGLFNRLEIWQEDAWKIYQKDSEASSNDIASKLTDLGI